MRSIATAVFILICLYIAIDETLGQGYLDWGHGWGWRNRRRCTWVLNCQECTGLKCTRCDRGYYRVRRWFGGDSCVRRCPGQLVPRNGLCTSRYVDCRRYGLFGCKSCVSRYSCKKCAIGYFGLKRRVFLGTKCVRRCPYGYREEWDRQQGMFMCKYKQKCKRQGNCLSCPGYNSCVTCGLGYIPAMAPGNKSLICKPQQKAVCPSIPNCGKCYLRNSCDRCAPGYYTYQPRLLDGARCVRSCPSGYEARNYTTWPTCKRVPRRGKCSSPNCAECPWRWSCKRCDPGFALYKRTLWSECLKTCPRLYRPVLDAENKTLVCKYKPAPPPNACSFKTCLHPHATCKERKGVAECVCDRQCDRMYDPVCGSDGKTYNSECMMRLLTCEKNVSVAVDYQGECASDVSYHIQTQPAQNCHDVCRSHNLICVAEDHGFSYEDVKELFEDTGVSCKTGDDTSDMYQWGENPSYIKASAFKKEKWAGRCIGWKNIPSRIDCSAVPRRPTIQRLCPCRWDIAATPQTKANPETPYTTPEEPSAEPDPTTKTEPRGHLLTPEQP